MFLFFKIMCKEFFLKIFLKFYLSLILEACKININFGVSMKTGNEKIKEICDAIKKETLDPAKEKAKEIIENAEIEAENIIRKANEEKDKILKQSNKDLELQKKIRGIYEKISF